jgi:hypothetical protein
MVPRPGFPFGENFVLTNWESTPFPGSSSRPQLQGHQLPVPFSLKPRVGESPMLLFEQISKRTEIKVQIGWGQPKVIGKFMDLPLELHQSLSHLLDLLVGQRTSLHAANGLALEQLSQEFNQPQNQLGEPLLDVLW